MTRQPLERLQPTLPAHWYRDADHYERELEALWYRRWVAVAREEEILAPGDWRAVVLGTQPLLLLRDEAGAIRAFYNVCRHRGSVLCAGERGRFASGRIVCPYHAWTYALDGTLRATPRRMETPDFRAADFPLHAVAVDTWGGFVFVHLGERPEPLAATLEGRPQRYAHYDFAGLRIGKRIAADVQANWKLLAENFSECLHCPPVHPELCRIVTAYQEAGAWGLRAAVEATPEYRAGATTLTLDGTARLPPFARLDEKERRRLYLADLLPPNLFLNVHPDYVNSQLVFPTGPRSVRIVYDWLFEPRHLPLADADLEHYVGLWDITNRQDARNCEWQQQGLAARAFVRGVYLPQEFDAHRFAQWVRAGLAGEEKADEG